MTDITLVKRADLQLSDAQRAALHLALFEMVDGLSESDQKSWRRFWNWIVRAGAGEIFSIETWAPRHGGFHRRHMVLETTVFKSQDRIKNFEQFRNWLKIGAGFCDWLAGPKGGVVPVPRSISYRKCDEDAMRSFHDDAIEFLRSEHACRYLWPALTAEAAEAAMESILMEFDE
ncbi:DUF1367 family protein [Burkholderia pseudomallei]|uniref:DUF1367 family protein n=1 Tax=Burkholderia pseudomallei TaxID=28450 RepID=UPI0009759CD9|nr:DUF1367 family protein [Burkholderia pseudomallei]OMQ57092.1 hypothetical protein AQ709_26705 [Burkholderia pseudomallei]OMQ65158.1 hypothetical protein AQ712_13115 [Burkholderia pseudomallei]OMQ72889.1 hypothetical protein AQ711_02575 [Burkholderia pseudomallei]CAJ2716763.1 Protein of uncharacterised function (DUF1367) [Burkholderia pseudomallei]CAJ4669694.1 Protein of uncharacterised function (DUF1367) [Burkholderia pseudomallei]